MFNGDISQSLDRNHSLSLFYSRRTPSKSKPIKKQSKFSLPTGEYLSPAKVNTPYNSTTTPVLVHSLSDMSLKNEDTDDDRLALDDSPTPACRYKKFFTKPNKNTSNIIENTIPLYPQKLKNKSNSVSKIEGKHNQMSLPSIQRSRMSTLMIKRKPVNLFANFSQDEKDSSNDVLIDKNESTYVNDKSEMNLDEQNNESDDCPHSKGFVNEDGIWEDPTLSQSESRCLQITVGNIIKSNEEYDDMKEKIENNNDKTLLWEFEDENKYDKENIIPDDYKGGILAEREWCDLSVEEDSVMEEYGNTNDDMIGSSSQTKSTLEKGKSSVSNSMIKKSEHQHVRYAFQEISINSMPEYQMGLCDCYSVYSNSSFGSTCDSQKMATPKKGAGFKMNNSYSKSNEFNNSFNSNDNIDFDDSTPSFFNTLPLIKSLKGNPSTSSIKKSSSSKKLVYQLCGVPDINGIHKKSISKNKSIEKKNIGEISYNSTSYMNSSPIISKSSILSPPFLLSSPVVRNGFSSPLVQTKKDSFNLSNGDSIENYNPFAKKDTIEASVEKTPKPRKVKSLLTTSINNSLSSDGEDSKFLENSNTSESKTLPKDTNFEEEEENEKITPKPSHIDSAVSILESNTSIESDHSKAPSDIVFFPHYHSRQHSQIANNDIFTSKGNKIIDNSLIDQTSNMMSISPTTLSKINQSHQNFLQSNPIFDSAIRESPTSINLPKRSKNSVEDKKKELSNRRRARLKKYVF